jgi:hypothetical protein
MKKYFFTALLLFGILFKGKGQGCSDAGFCSAGSIKASNNDSIKNSLGFSVGYAIGEQGTTIITPQFEPQIKISDKSMVQIKIPFQFINGDLGSNKGLGDAIVTYNLNVTNLGKKPLTFTLGTRIATSTSSEKRDNIPMPMTYQVGLGTTDLIVGARIQFKKGFSVSLGYQQPLFNRNQNGFDSAAYKNLKLAKQLPDDENYFISSYLERKGDIMMRLDKLFKIKKSTFSIGILPIYHLGKDKARINKGTIVNLENSQGLTLNINAGLNYKISNKLEISAIAAAPLIVRKSRPDGLTRAIIFVPALRYNL